MEFFSLILIFLVTVFASFVSVMVGSGGLITIPFLVFMGLPAQIAIATHRMGTLGFHVGSLTRFWNKQKIQWNYVLPFIFIDLISTFVGASILISINSDLLTKALGFILLIFLPLSFVKKDFGTVSKRVSNKQKLLGVLAYFLVGLWGGFFGGGAGTLIYTVGVYFFGFTFLEASATTKIPGFLAGLLAVFLFGLNQLIDYQIGFVMLLAMAIGSYLGAHVALKQGDAWLKGLFALVVLVLALKLIFFN